MNLILSQGLITLVLILIFKLLNMKKLIAVIFSSLIFSMHFSSCEEIMGGYLDKAPGIDVTEDSIFSSVVNVDRFLATIYRYSVHSNLPYFTETWKDPSNYDETLSSGASDESETCAAWYSTQKWNSGSLTPDDIQDKRYDFRWVALRQIAIMIERVNEVPDISTSYANQIVSEMRTLRALNYLEMMKRYGGVPIIDHRINLDEDLKISRSSLKDVLDFIIEDCDFAINCSDFPDDQVGIMKGRVTRGVALSIKAKALLYAASPLFNTDTPYMTLGANNDLICLGEYNHELWKQAADASLAVLKWAESTGHHLITDKGVDNNYRYSWEVYDNPEIIFAEKAHGETGTWDWPWSAISPPNIYPGNRGQSGISPTLNFVKKYEKRDGKDQYWNPNGGDNLQALMGELDRRFAQTIAYNKSIWNDEKGEVQIWEGGRDASTCFGGFWLHKHFPSKINNSQPRLIPNSTLFQLNEFYLSYAEALNEYNHGPNDEAYNAINAIRARSGQPELVNLDYKTFKQRVHRERDVELAFDNHRLWDIMRWKVAEEEGVMQGNMWGIKISKIDGSDEFRYKPYVFEQRHFHKRMYLNPFPTYEINKGYLIQNPGY